jgi:cytochrome c
MVYPELRAVIARLLAGGIVVSGTSMVHATGDAAGGAKVFQACMACHSVRPDEHMTGPSLAHVIGRKAGTASGFPRYSEALLRSPLVWTEGNLDRWLANPAKTIPGNSMTFPGLREARDRLDVIAYLAAVSDGRARAVPQQDKLNLKEAPARARVASIQHCGDTYVVRNGAGETVKFWEPNLRFRTDSSAKGPAAGRPVMLPTGMQGDRASVIFATPAEISRFIKPSC